MVDTAFLNAKTEVEPTVSDFVVGIDKSDTGGNGSGAVKLFVAPRPRLKANRTYYVDGASGSDANDGLASGSGAFATLQHAYDVVNGIDFNGYTVTIAVADGTYTSGVSIAKGWHGGGTLIYEGNLTTPANCIVSTTSADCFLTSGFLGGVLIVRGFKGQTTTAGQVINHTAVGEMRYRNMDFGACAGSHISVQSKSSKITASGNYTISGSVSVSHFYGVSGEIWVQNRTLTITGTPAFGFAFAAGLNQSYLELSGNTYSGSATGARYYAAALGFINTNGAGATALPGDASGVGTNPGASPYGYYA